jgi:hypothetical protein
VTSPIGPHRGRWYRFKSVSIESFESWTGTLSRVAAAVCRTPHTLHPTPCALRQQASARYLRGKGDRCQGVCRRRGQGLKPATPVALLRADVRDIYLRDSFQVPLNPQTPNPNPPEVPIQPTLNTTACPNTSRDSDPKPQTPNPEPRTPNPERETGGGRCWWGFSSSPTS